MSGSHSDHLVPIARSQFSFFNPSRDMGAWEEFDRPWIYMRQQMRDLERQFEEMYHNFWRLEPTHERSSPYGHRLQGAPTALDTPAVVLPSTRPWATLTGAPGGSAPGTPVVAPSGTSPWAALTGPPVGCTSGTPVSPESSPWASMGKDHIGMGDCGALARPSPGWGAPAPIVDPSDSPIVTMPDGSKRLKLTFDVRQFKPEEILVKTQDQQLLVTAKHEENTESSRAYTEYHRMFTLPPSVIPEDLRSSLSREGVLSIEALVSPAPQAPKEVIIPIAHEKSSTPTSEAATEAKTEEC